jgi:hypothetical protein
MKKKIYFFICLLFTIISSFTFSKSCKNKDINPLIGEWMAIGKPDYFDKPDSVILKIVDSINIEMTFKIFQSIEDEDGNIGTELSIRRAIGVYTINKNDSITINIDYGIIENDTIHEEMPDFHLHFERKNNLITNRMDEKEPLVFYPKNYK